MLRMRRPRLLSRSACCPRCLLLFVPFLQRHKEVPAFIRLGHLVLQLILPSGYLRTTHPVLVSLISHLLHQSGGRAAGRVRLTPRQWWGWMSIGGVKKWTGPKSGIGGFKDSRLLNLRALPRGRVAV